MKRVVEEVLDLCYAPCKR